MTRFRFTLAADESSAAKVKHRRVCSAVCHAASAHPWPTRTSDAIANARAGSAFFPANNENPARPGVGALTRRPGGARLLSEPKKNRPAPTLAIADALASAPCPMFCACPPGRKDEDLAVRFTAEKLRGVQVFDIPSDHGSSDRSLRGSAPYADPLSRSHAIYLKPGETRPQGPQAEETR